jgi:hypothetical protein
MEPYLEQANRALFEGDRQKVFDLLHQRAATGAELWLLAAAVQDEDERLGLLRRVWATGEQPYADLAEDILRREAEFARLLAEGSPVLAWLGQHRVIVLRVGWALFVLAVTAIVVTLILR